MLEIEKIEIENELFSSLSPTLVPIEITTSNGETRIVTFSKAISVAKEFEKRYIKEQFSKEAIDFLESEMSDIINEWGYFTDDYFPKHIFTYVANDVNEDLILSSTKMLKSIDGYENLTEYELESLDEDAVETYFATIVDDKIVSVCEMNADDAFIGATEINVYTNENYRKNGFAVSNATAMAKYLISLCKRVAYTAPKENISSQMVAEKCGFEKIAETYYYICYKEE
jgi:RimJ/RimL family protein N-acetyltransferase